MIILSKKSVNPHLKLFALSQPPLNSSPETPLQKLNLLASTRQFDAIEAATQQVKNISFPTLKASTFCLMKISKKLSNHLKSKKKNYKVQKSMKSSKK